MDVRLVTSSEWWVVGMNFYGDPFDRASGWSEENEIGLLWKRFMTFLETNPEAIQEQADPGVALEIHLETDETGEKGVFEVFVGVRVTRLAPAPLECTIKTLPATQYAVFTLHGPEITSDWGQLIGNWMSQSGYERAHRYGIQYYDQRFKGLERIEESTLDVYVPIRRTTSG